MITALVVSQTHDRFVVSMAYITTFEYYWPKEFVYESTSWHQSVDSLRLRRRELSQYASTPGVSLAY